MKLADRLQESQDTERVRVIEGWYETVEDGHVRPMPVLHFNARSVDDNYRHFSVEGYRPYFLVPRQDVDDETLSALNADRRVMDISLSERDGIDSGESGLIMAKITCEQPYHVAQLRDEFDRPFEADVLFPNRFLVDQGVKAHAEIPDGETELEPSDVTAADPEPRIDPRVCTWDIEVEVSDGLPDQSSPSDPLTGVTMHDSHSDQYLTVAVRGDASCWKNIPPQFRLDRYDAHGVCAVVESEQELIHTVVDQFCEWRPGVLTGWNSNSFDWPYFINRAMHTGEKAAVERLSPTGNVQEHEDGGKYVNSDVGGIHLWDALEGYKQTQYTELKSYSLEDVAAAETDLPKLDVDEQTAYQEKPHRFMKYNLRDVEATRAIIEELNLI